MMIPYDGNYQRGDDNDVDDNDKMSITCRQIRIIKNDYDKHGRENNK